MTAIPTRRPILPSSPASDAIRLAAEQRLTRALTAQLNAIGAGRAVTPAQREEERQARRAAWIAAGCPK